MSIDILSVKPGQDVFEACPQLAEIKCFNDYLKDPDPHIPTRELIMYVVLLYSKDSILNRKPIEELPTRRLKAAKMAGLDTDSEMVVSRVFDLESVEKKITDDNGKYKYSVYEDRIAELITEYLIYQNHYSWSDRVSVELQMQENLRIRMSPIEKTKGDKETIEASTKKFVLGEHFSKYKEQLKKIDSEIFSDHENIKEHIKKRTTLESFV